MGCGSRSAKSFEGAEVLMQMDPEVIGPEGARKLLELVNEEFCRTPNPRWVTSFAEEMRQGRWLPAGGSIKVDDERGLIDGRRRLLAVLESGLEIQFLVIRGKFKLFGVRESGMTRA